MNISNCYDSHLHLLYTGVALSQLDLKFMNSIEDLSLLKPLPQHFCGSWLTGFGWDNNKWQSHFPTAQQLDTVFPDFPVAFSRADGHAIWLNSKAMALIPSSLREHFKNSNMAIKNSSLELTGVFLDDDKIQIDQLIPRYNIEQVEEFLLSAQEHILSKGITHVRDMTCTALQWQALQKLDCEKKWKLYTELHFVSDQYSDLEQVIKQCQSARSEASDLFRILGPKIFIDGALGSEGAFLSHPYGSGSGRGQLLWKVSDIESAIEKSWSAGFEIAIHTIGDESVHQATLATEKAVRKGFKGKVHLEHCQVVRKETIQIMKALPIVIHMQPSHFYSDQSWASVKLGSLYEISYQWTKLIDAGLEVHFGSDSPIEPVGIENTWLGLKAAADKNLSPVPTDWWKRHQHPDKEWGNLCSQFDTGNLPTKTKN